jgi:hypothetical protein
MKQYFLLMCVMTALVSGCHQGGDASSPDVATSTVNVTGYWLVSTAAQDGPHNAILYLSQVGRDVVGVVADYGSVSSLAGLVDGYTAGTVSGDVLDLHVSGIHATVTGDFMHGATFDAQRNGGAIGYTGPVPAAGATPNPIGTWDWDAGDAHVNTHHGWWPYLRFTYYDPNGPDRMFGNLLGMPVTAEFFGLEGAMYGHAVVFRLNGCDTFLGGINGGAMNGLWVHNADEPSQAARLEEGRWSATKRP